MTRAPAGFALLAACCLVACGSGSHPASTAGHAPTPDATHGPGTSTSRPAPVTKTRALAFAHAVNLRAGDVPGFRVSSTHRHDTAQERRLEGALMRCLGVSPATRTLAEASSVDFERNAALSELSVSSSVSVARSATEASRNLAVLRGPHTRSCLTRYMLAILAGSAFRGGIPGPIAVHLGTPPAPGTSGGYGIRVTTSVRVRGLPIPLDLDILGFVDGASDVSLLSSGVPVAFPARAQQQLYELLLARARSHTL